MRVGSRRTWVLIRQEGGRLRQFRRWTDSDCRQSKADLAFRFLLLAPLAAAPIEPDRDEPYSYWLEASLLITRARAPIVSNRAEPSRAEGTETSKRLVKEAKIVSEE